MIGRALQMYAEDLGFTVTEDCAYGIYEGYLMTLYDNINRKTCFINYYLSETDESDLQKKYELSEFIKANIDNFQINDYEVDINGVSVSIKEGLVKLSELIKLTIAKLSELGITGTTNCSECGKEVPDGALKKVAVEYNRYGLCDECTVSLLEASDEKATNDDNNDEDKKITSKAWLSTLIVIIGGTLIWSLLGIFNVFGENNNLIVGVLMAILLPIIHVRLYDIFGGQQGNKRLITISVSIVVIALLSNYISEIGNAYSDVGITDIGIIFKSLEYALVEPLEINKSFFSIPFYKNTIVSILVAFISIILFASDLLKPKTQSNKGIKVD